MTRIHLTMMMTVLAVALAAPAGAQGGPQPWQGTFTKTTHDGDFSKAFIDLPMPGPGKRLMLERIAVGYGQAVNVYGQIWDCVVETSQPKVRVMGLTEPLTRIRLPKPEGIALRTYAIPDTPLKLWVEDGGPNGIFRVSCTGQAILNGDKFSVTAVGTLTDK
jgi:hypothetical protein